MLGRAILDLEVVEVQVTYSYMSSLAISCLLAGESNRQQDVQKEKRRIVLTVVLCLRLRWMW